MFKRLATALLALTIGCTTPMDGGYREARLRPPDEDHPVDVNTDYTLALSEELGHLEEGFTAGDRYALVRPGKAVAMLWLHGAISYWSHEMGHAYNTPAKDERGWKMESGWNSADLPEVVFKQGTTTLENQFYSLAAGLNQNENNSQELWKRTDKITLDRALAFLAFKLDDSTYNIRNTFEEDGESFRMKYFNRKPGKNEYLYAPSIPGETTWNDLRQISRVYEFWGIPGGREKELERRARIADLATARTWESLWVVGKYLATGQRSSQPLVFDFDGHSLSPPIVSSYFTTRGVFYNGSVKVDEHTVSVGRNVDSPDWSIGVGLGERQVGCFSVSPFVAFNRVGGENGFTLGSDIGFELGDNASLVLNVQRSKNDILENDVKIVGNGTDVQVGLRIKW